MNRILLAYNKMYSLTRVSIDGDTQMPLVNCSTLNDLKIERIWKHFDISSMSNMDKMQ